MAALFNRVKSYRLAFGILLAAVVIFRLWYMTTLPLSGDEAYHWEWSRHPAFGYYDHPGLTAYVILASTKLFGGSTEFSVRFPAVLLLAGTSILAFMCARFVARCRGGSDVDAERAGFLAGTLVTVVGIYAFFAMYISTDPPLIFFWMLSLYLLCRAFYGGGWLSWLGAGAALGFAMLSKFLAAFLVLAVLLYVIMSPRDRVWFRRPKSYVAALLAMLVFSPFVWWNATHGWATFMFNFVYRQHNDSMALAAVLNRVGVFLGVQLLVLTPGVFLFGIYGMWRAFRDWRRTRERTSLFLGLCSFVPLSYFLVESLQQEISPHWPAAGWLATIIYVSCYWAAEHNLTRVHLKRVLRVSSISIAVAFFVLIHLAMHIPPSWISYWEYKRNPGRINTKQNLERFGWKELGEWVEENRNNMLSDPARNGRNVFVICNQYGLAAAVSFYTPSQITTHLWGKRRTCGENYRFWDDYPSMEGQDAIFVSKKKDRLEAEIGRPAFTNMYFTSGIGKIKTLSVPVEDADDRKFYLVECMDYSGVVPQFEE